VSCECIDLALVIADKHAIHFNTPDQVAAQPLSSVTMKEACVRVPFSDSLFLPPLLPVCGTLSDYQSEAVLGACAELQFCRGQRTCFFKYIEKQNKEFAIWDNGWRRPVTPSQNLYRRPSRLQTPSKEIGNVSVGSCIMPSGENNREESPIA
jgi:hypothetical protein